MFKKFILLAMMLGLTLSAYPAWDEDGVSGTNTVAANTTAIIANNAAINTVIGTMLDTGTAVTSTATELNALDGITSTVTELNYTDGVTSAIQTQLDDGVRLPSGACFFMLTGSCPTGTTDVTSTYTGRFVKAGTSQGTTAGPILTGAADSHTLTIAETPSHRHASKQSTTVNPTAPGASGTGDYRDQYTGYTGGGGGHTHNLSSATTLEPKSVQMKWCSVD